MHHLSFADSRLQRRGHIHSIRRPSMTMHEYTNHSSQAGSQTRTPGRAVRLVLALAVGLTAFAPLNSNAQAPADKTKKPGLAYDVHQSIELGGHVVSNSGS